MRLATKIAALFASVEAISLQQAREHFKMAQTTQSSRTHSCTATFERLLNTTDDYTMPQANFEDVNFPTDDALFWPDAGEEGKDMDQIDHNVTWARISDPDFPTMNGYEKTLWGPSRDASSITPSDMNQGYIGNCWIISAVSAMAEVPGRIDRIIENEFISQDGIYALNMYLLGVPFTMIIDDKMPLNQWGNTYFGGLGKDGSVWGAVIEKAFAKYYGAYEHMIGGFMERAVTALNGSPHIDL